MTMEQSLFRFQSPELLYLLLVIPVLLVLFQLYRMANRRGLRRFGEESLVEGLMPERSKGRPVWKFLLLLAAYTALVFALARPQYGSRLEEVKKKGVEIMIALDVSNSMMAEDIQPSRLERAKQAISRLVDNLADDKIGLVVFAGDAYMQVPITNDYLSVKMFLDGVGPEMVPRQGTAIGSAIELAMKSFSPASEAGKSIIVITDGENHEDDAVGAAKEAAGKGITVYTLGMGLPQGAPIPVGGSGNSRNFLKDRDGKVVISKLDENMLSEIAAAGNGTYVRANNSRLGLGVLMEKINGMEKAELETRVFSEYDERFQYLAGLAFFLLLMEALLLDRKNKWISRINLFGK